ncbi:MAG: DMT family transporter [Rhodobacterales bacterium]|nr:DMT family transporter [Rhodobacterales bacterium]
MTEARSQALRGHMAMLLFSALVAGSFSLGSMAANHIAPAALNSARFAIAAVIVGIAAVASGALSRQNYRSYFSAPWRYFLLGAIFAGYFVLMFEGLKTATPVSTAAVFTLTPLMSAFFAYFLLRQITTSHTALALAIGAVGAIWVIFRADIAALLRFNIGKGEVIYFVGCVAHAVYTPLVRKLNRGEPALVFTFGMLLAGFVVITIWALGDIAKTDWHALPIIVWVTLIYISVFASSMTFVLLQFSVLRLPAAKVMAYTYLTPTWVIVWELLLGHGVPPVLVLGGIGLTIVALVMLLKDEG